MFIYFWERERVRVHMHVNGGGAEREGDPESEVGSRLRAVSTKPDMGLEPTNCEIMTWAEIKSWVLNQLSHPGAPEVHIAYLFLHEWAAWRFGILPAGSEIAALASARHGPSFSIFASLSGETYFFILIALKKNLGEVVSFCNS